MHRENVQQVESLLLALKEFVEEQGVYCVWQKSRKNKNKQKGWLKRDETCSLCSCYLSLYLSASSSFEFVVLVGIGTDSKRHTQWILKGR